MARLPLFLALTGALLASACGGSPAPVTGLRVTEIAIYQGVKVTVMRDGQAVEPSAPIVRRKAAMLRVFVELAAGWQAREVLGRLELSAGTKRFPTIEARATIAGASTDGDLASTLTFDIPGDRLTMNLQFSVALFEGKGGAPTQGSTEGGFYPASGKVPLPVQDAGKSLEVVLVPLRYTADGSNRLPDLSAAQQDRFRNMMLATYPAPLVNLTVHEPVDLQSTVSAGGSGWSQALQVVLGLRRNDRAARNVYYYGLMAPASSFEAYCSGGCITGLSTGSDNPDEESVRGSIGIGFGGSHGDSDAGTFVHEVGHAHGRDHAPCGLEGQPADRNFPYGGASIGVWGYGIVDKRLRSPSDHKDFMSYCDPIWVSDYTYRGLFDRISYVNYFFGVGEPLTVAQEGRPYRMLSLEGSELLWGERIDLDREPMGKEVWVARLDAHGVEVGRFKGWFFPFSHLEGGLVFVPEAELHGAAVQLRGRQLDLPKVGRAEGPR